MNLLFNTNTKCVTIVAGLTSFCIYYYYHHQYNDKSCIAICDDQHIGDGKLMPTIKLNNNNNNNNNNNSMELPLLGLGTWELGNINNKFDKNIIENVISHAINIGYRHIDCASDYLNEHLIGDALEKLFKSNKISRNELFITSKLNQNYHSAKHVKKQLKKTLLDLKIDYLDLFLIHWPFSFKYVSFKDNVRGWDETYDSWNKLLIPGIPLKETWTAMEQLVDEGLVKSIGVSNFNVQLLYDLLTYATIKPSVNQIEIHPYNSQNNLIKFCQLNSIQVIAYSAIGTTANKNKNDKELLKDDILNKIGKKYKVSAAQVALKWNLQRNVAVLTKSNNIERISENHSLFHFKLNQQDMQQINNINQNLRYLRPEQWDITKDLPIFD